MGDGDHCAGPALGLIPGLIVAAPASGSGKTVITLALARAYGNAGLSVAAAKTGPDYIDPAYLGAATRHGCINLDSWAMRAATLAGLVEGLNRDSDLILCEGVMGLFDGAAGGGGSTADLAALTGWPVVLVIDASRQAGSIAALIEGFVRHRPEITIGAVICNRVGSPNHRRMLDEALATVTPEIPAVEFLPTDPALALPERHLGLVQASEHCALDRFLDRAATFVASHLNLDRLRACARPSRLTGTNTPILLPPLGQRIAVARDDAFAFSYPAVLAGWRVQGAEVSFFSPLEDQAPDRAADSVYLPGGYPELYAGRLAGNENFKKSLTRAAAAGIAVYGECGGYMVLGRGLVDSDGARHALCGLLPLETSFAQRRRQLGYRRLRIKTPSFLGDPGARFTGHEFHYASVVSEGPGERLFDCADSRGDALPPAGLIAGNTAGSFIHLIDCAP